MLIYKVQNLKNGKIYIGQTTKTLEWRWKHHCNAKSCCTYLSNAIKKYGVENFVVEQIDSARTQKELNEKERYWIKQYNSLAPNGYNLTTGGEHPIVTDVTKKILSDQRKGKRPHAFDENFRKKISEFAKTRTGVKNPNFGNKWTDEQKKRMSEINKGCVSPRKGVKLSEETKLKVSLSLKGKYAGEKSHNWGKPRSDETKRKLSLANMNKRMGRDNHKSKRVVCIETGEIFESMREVERIKGFKSSHISDVCRGVRHTSHGYHWEYVKEVC